MAMRIVLADDHLMIRQCLKQHLESEGFVIVGEAGDGAEAVKLVETLHPRVAVLDFSMPTLNGIDASREIARRSPSTKAILLTAYCEDQYVIAALRAGVVGYVLKSKAVQDLVSALWEVDRGNLYLSPSISRAVVQEMLNKNASPSDVLSPRERQILQLIAEGKTTKEAAFQLGISTKTAESHRSNIIEKLNIHETAGLVRYALRIGLIQL
jgi:DNA-binding NarL/FixJ family response regulator